MLHLIVSAIDTPTRNSLEEELASTFLELEGNGVYGKHYLNHAMESNNDLFVFVRSWRRRCIIAYNLMIHSQFQVGRIPTPSHRRFDRI